MGFRPSLLARLSLAPWSSSRMAHSVFFIFEVVPKKKKRRWRTTGEAGAAPTTHDAGLPEKKKKARTEKWCPAAVVDRIDLGATLQKDFDHPAVATRGCPVQRSVARRRPQVNRDTFCDEYLDHFCRPGTNGVVQQKAALPRGELSTDVLSVDGEGELGGSIQ